MASPLAFRPDKKRPSSVIKGLGAILLLINLMGCVASTPRGFYKRGTEAIAQGEFKQGIASLSRAIKSQPNFSEAYVNRGIAYAELGEFKNAIADYKQAIELNPKLTDAHYNLGNVLLQTGKEDAAIAAYTEALKLESNFAYALGNRAKSYEQTGDLEAAIADLKAAIQLFNSQGEIQAALAAQKQLDTLQDASEEP